MATQRNGTSVRPLHRAVSISLILNSKAAYFSQLRVDELATVDHMPTVARLPVPEGRYSSARSSKHRSRDDGRRFKSRGSISEYSSPQPHSPLETDSRQIYSPRLPPVTSLPQHLPSISQASSETKKAITNPPNTAMLVPLSHLQNPHNRLSPPQRYPEDEKLLRSLTFGA